MSTMQEIQTNGLVSDTELGKSEITVKLLGSAETSAMAELDAFLRRVHAHVMDAKLPEVTIDVRALDFMNSSCFKTFVSWIGVVQELPPEQQYKVRFVADDKKHWQSRSLGALACFAVDLIRIESS